MRTVDWSVVAAALFALAAAVWLVADVIRYHTVVGTTANSWFGTWMAMPYTNARVLLASSREYATPNAIKSEMWRVREAVIGGTAFWTVLERTPVS